MPVVNPTTVPPTETVSPFGFLAQSFAWMLQNWIYVGVALLLAIGAYAVYRIWIKQKEEDDVFLVDYKRTKDMCKLQKNGKRVRSSPIPIFIFGFFFFIGIGMLIIGVLMNWGNFLSWSYGVFGIGVLISGIISWLGIFKTRDRIYLTSGKTSKFIGFYAGECITENMKNYLIEKGMGPSKTDFVVRTSLDKTLTVKIPNEVNGKKSKDQVKTMSIAIPDDAVIEGEDSILIKGLGLQQFRYFLYPILEDESGNPISMKFIATALEKDIALVDTLYNQTSDFANVMREQVNMNPTVRFRTKVGGDSGAE